MPFVSVSDIRHEGTWEFSDAEQTAHALNNLELSKIQIHKRQSAKFVALPFANQSSLTDILFQFDTGSHLPLGFSVTSFIVIKARAPPVFA